MVTTRRTPTTTPARMASPTAPMPTTADTTTTTPTTADTTTTTEATPTTAPAREGDGVTPRGPQRAQKSWFERASYALLVGSALALPSQAQAQQPPQPSVAQRMTPASPHGATSRGAGGATSRGAGGATSATSGAKAQGRVDAASLRQDLNGLYAGAMQELHALYREKGLSAHPDVAADAQRLVDKALARVTSSWSPQEKAALDRTMGTLDQLAGGDGRFNHGDKLAIVHALLQDKSGILRMAHQAIDEKLPGLGNRIAHRLVDNAYTPTRRFERTGRAGPIQRLRDHRRDKIEGLAAQAMHQQLNQSLGELHVDPATAQRLDRACRRLTIDQVVGMAGDLRVLQRKLGQMTSGSGGAVDNHAVLARLRTALRDNVDVVAPPLRNGVPSPRNIDALIDTALDAAEGLRLRPP